MRVEERVRGRAAVSGDAGDARDGRGRRMKGRRRGLPAAADDGDRAVPGGILREPVQRELVVCRWRCRMRGSRAAELFCTNRKGDRADEGDPADAQRRSGVADAVGRAVFDSGRGIPGDGRGGGAAGGRRGVARGEGRLRGARDGGGRGGEGRGEGGRVGVLHVDVSGGRDGVERDGRECAAAAAGGVAG